MNRAVVFLFVVRRGWGLLWEVDIDENVDIREISFLAKSGGKFHLTSIGPGYEG